MRALLLLLFALTACGRIGFSDAVGTDGLVAYYPMDDNPADGIVDCAGCAELNGTCPVTRCPDASSGYIGQSILFSSDIVVLPPAVLPSGAAFSISAWVRFDDFSDDRSLVSKPSSETGETNALCLYVDNQLNRITYEATEDQISFDYLAGPILTLDRWYHLAITRDGDTRRIYVDGVLGGERTLAVVDSDRSVYLGSDWDNDLPTFFHDGSIDELRIYDRALTEAEIGVLASE